MEKVCPRCKLPQEGVYECEYCGLVFAQYTKEAKKKPERENIIEKKSIQKKWIYILLALVGFAGAVFFQYQRESAKTIAELEEKRKQKVIEQNRKQQKSERNKSDSKANRTQKMTSSISPRVICNKFSVNTEINGKDIEFWLDTDLPNDTIVMVSLDRLYWQKGNADTYSNSYYAKRSSVRQLLKPVNVVIDENQWRLKLEKKQKLFASIGEPFKVSKISENVDLNLTVPINQKNPAFGKRNINLEGIKVRDSNDLQIIREKQSFLIPLGKELSAQILAKKQYSLNAYNLETNVLYKISKKTPIFKELDPVDKIKAIAEMRNLPVDSVIRILRKVEKRSMTYYYIRADVRGDTRKKAEGWINGGALLGQDLRVIE
jgi:hypothetical protein